MDADGRHPGPNYLAAFLLTFLAAFFGERLAVFGVAAAFLAVFLAMVLAPYAGARRIKRRCCPLGTQ